MGPRPVATVPHAARAAADSLKRQIGRLSNAALINAAISAPASPAGDTTRETIHKSAGATGKPRATATTP